MEAFLKEQLKKVEAEIQQLIIDRGRASIETVGSYEIMIERKKKELLRLTAEIEESQHGTNNIQRDDKPNNEAAKTKVKNFIKKSQTEKAIELMLETWPDASSIQVINGNFYRIKNENNMGIMRNDDYQTESNKINYRLLSILKDL